jgi:hypothetical protein
MASGTSGGDINMAFPTRQETDMALGDFVDYNTFSNFQTIATNGYLSINKAHKPTIDIRKWKIEQEYVSDSGAVVVQIQYIDFTDEFDGKKLLVYGDYEQFYQIRNSGEIDPSLKKSSPSPFAVLEPTEVGWKKAIDFADKHEAS